MAALAIAALVAAVLVLLDALAWDGEGAMIARVRARFARQPAIPVNTISSLATLTARIERLQTLKQAGFLSEADCARQELSLLADVREL